MRRRDPALMTRQERLQEIADILATAFRRLQIQPQHSLASGSRAASLAISTITAPVASSISRKRHPPADGASRTTTVKPSPRGSADTGPSRRFVDHIPDTGRGVLELRRISTSRPTRVRTRRPAAEDDSSGSRRWVASAPLSGIPSKARGASVAI